MTPRPAATVVVVRDAAEGGIEVLLVERHRGLRFMGGMHVFPGGSLHATDTASCMRLLADTVHGWPDQPSAEFSRGLVLTAIRETFEEAGLLFGHVPATQDLPALRARLRAGTSFDALLEEAGITLNSSALQPLSRWITPRSEPLRFDTRFYLARAPESQSASADGEETVSLRFSSPQAAHNDARAGRIVLAPPTWHTLNELQDASSVAELFTRCAERAPVLIEPIMEIRHDRRVILYPGDPDHPVRERALKGPTRNEF